MVIPFLLLLFLVESFGQDGQVDDSAITFPDQELRLAKERVPKLMPQGLAKQRTSKLIPQGCSNEDEFCEEPPDYPDVKLIRKLLRNETSGAKAILFRRSKPLKQSRMRMGDLFDEKDNLVETAVRSVYTAGDSAILEPTDRDRAILEPTDRDSAILEPTDRDRAILKPTSGISTDVDYVDLVEESPICDSAESFVYPRTARNLDNKWRFVINVPRDEEDDEYVQAVKVERCLRPGRSCNIDSVSGIETVCRQKYSLRRLLALSQEGYQYVDVFKFPSCCICHQKRDLTLGIPIQTSDTQIDIRDEDSRNHSWW